MLSLFRNAGQSIYLDDHATSENHEIKVLSHADKSAKLKVGDREVEVVRSQSFDICDGAFGVLVDIDRGVKIAIHAENRYRISRSE